MHLFSRVFHRKLDAQLVLCLGCGWTVPNLRGLLLSRALSGDGRDAMLSSQLGVRRTIHARSPLSLSPTVWFGVNPVELHRMITGSAPSVQRKELFLLYGAEVTSEGVITPDRGRARDRAPEHDVKASRANVYLHVCNAVHCFCYLFRFIKSEVLKGTFAVKQSTLHVYRPTNVSY